MELPVIPLHLMASFLAFADAKNMEEAARRVGLSQPALTAHLKALETYFPQDVFAMNGRKKVLTPFGSQLSEIVQERIRALNDDVLALNRKFEAPEQIRLKVAGRAEILSLIAPKVEFEGSLIFIDADGASATEGVVDRRFDLAISNHLAKAGPLHAAKIFTDQFQLVSPTLWVTKRSQLSGSLLEELLEKPYLAYKEQDANLNALLAHFGLRARPRLKRVLSDWPSIIEMVEAGRGWTLAPSTYTTDSAKLRALNVPTSVVAEVVFYCLYRKELTTMPWFKSLLQEFKHAFG